MEVKVCKSCRRMFQYIAGPELCPICYKKEEEAFQKVKTYLRENPGESLAETSRQTEVSMRLIEKFLREERLEVPLDSEIKLLCVRCGKRIKTGVYCKECKNELTTQFNEVKRGFLVEKEKREDQQGKMRYLHSKNLK